MKMIKRNPFTKELKQEYFKYLTGYMDGIACTQINTHAVMISTEVFRRTRFFNRFHPELVSHKKFERTVNEWCKEFVEQHKL